MKPRRVELPAWAEPYARPGRNKSARGGRASTKTWAFAHLLVAAAANEPLKIACARAVQASIAVSSKSAIEIAIQRLQLGPLFDIREHYIKGNNGSVLLFKGLEGNREEIRGWESVDRVWVEEAQRISNETADILIPTIRKERSELWFSWNPNRPDDWVWQRFEANKRESDICAAVTYRDNRWFSDESEQDRLFDKRTKAEAMYRHIWEGDLIPSSGFNPFGGEGMIDACIDKGLTVDDATGMVHGLENTEPLAWGWDIARTPDVQGDFTVGIALNNEGVVCRVHYWKGIPLDVQQDRIKSIVGKRTFVCVDGTGMGRQLAEALEDKSYGDIESVIFTSSSKHQLITNLAWAVLDRTENFVTFPKGRIDQEMKSYSYEETSAGNPIYSHPVGKHDDHVDALALAWKAWKKGRGFRVRILH